MDVINRIFVPWGLALKCKNNELFTNFRNGAFSEKEITDFLQSLIDNWIIKRLSLKNKEEVVKELYAVYIDIFKDEQVNYTKTVKKLTEWQRNQLFGMLDI